MYQEIARNKRRTIALMFFFILFIAGIGALFSAIYNDFSILILVVTLTFVYTIFQYFMSGRIAVAMSGAKQIQKKDNRRLYNIVENLVIQEGMPMPKVYIMDDPSPNAFAAGRNPEHAIVAATTGLLDMMDDNELQAVMAHELAHVKNYDIRLSTIVFGLVSAIAIISEIGWRIGLFGGGRNRNNNSGGAIGVVILVVASILAPLIATIVQLAVSRQREFLADSSAALMTRHPESMISALRKLGQGPKPKHPPNAAMAPMYINATSAKALFSTHPPIAKRIERLEKSKKQF
ncbi:M48 family metalloprotease [Candidatus Saccharibacteria bacterium]|nr:M48 family metalloprotease [Candidatus Saccharibacteria bacterium]